MNQWLEQYLRFWCNERQDNWSKWLPFTEFVHNQWPNATMKKTPFDLVMGYMPKVEWPTHSYVPLVETRLSELDKARDEALRNIMWAQKAMALGNKGNGCFKPYKKGDQVWIEGTNIKTLYPTAKLGPKRHMPFKILEQLSEAVY